MADVSPLPAVQKEMKRCHLVLWRHWEAESHHQVPANGVNVDHKSIYFVSIQTNKQKTKHFGGLCESSGGKKMAISSRPRSCGFLSLSLCVCAGWVTLAQPDDPTRFVFYCIVVVLRAAGDNPLRGWRAHQEHPPPNMIPQGRLQNDDLTANKHWSIGWLFPLRSMRSNFTI